jgi:hypothetical protein
MTLAFKTKLPATRKLVLLALADAANDQGECYPSVTHLVGKCSLGERTIQEAISALEADGFIRREFRTGRATVYWLTLDAAQPPQQPHPRASRTPAAAAPTPARAAPLPPQQPHPTPAAAAPRTINEPSKEPLPNRKAPAVADVSAEVYADWLALRKAKRAPVTETAVAGIRREADKAGLSMQAALELCCQRGWTGFKAEWVAEQQRGAAPRLGAVDQSPSNGLALAESELKRQREHAEKAAKPPIELLQRVRQGVRAI